MKWHPAKLAVAIPLAVVAAFLAWNGGLIISIVFDDYKDSPDSTYLTIGGGLLGMSALFATAALLTVSGAPHRLVWLVLAVVAFLASALPNASDGRRDGICRQRCPGLAGGWFCTGLPHGRRAGVWQRAHVATPLASARSFCETGEDVRTQAVWK